MIKQECEFCDFSSEKHSNAHMKRAHRGMMEQPTPLVRHLPVDISVNRTDGGGKLRYLLSVKRTYRSVGLKVEMIRVVLW
jgi:hypothetical protein